ncbi:hypothetical protein PSYJA_01379 [Pseudomonas syringae pv. japonica str. M301072]|uniref:Uncharacterized protein n=1 Tax=Pseudomonas syringae pv. japonica str. M301072 TaxID=629262 RepID=F3FC05_PSESX|nr:hypothetical protein PSYJA_01379 [Pseudomonas syringae pv. japonica str. M301072]
MLLLLDVTIIDNAAPASAQQMNISSDRSMDGFRHQLITQLKRPIN